MRTIENLKRVFVLASVLMSLASCSSAAPGPSVSTPTSTASLTPSASPTLFTDTPPRTPTAAASATPKPTSPSTAIPTPDVALVRGPYLQSVTSGSIVVVWETDLPSSGGVAYGETQPYGTRRTDPSSSPSTHHAVTLTGLAPSTTYHYRIESGGAPLSEDYTFRTAANPDEPRFTFAVFGDTRTGHQAHRAVVERLVAWDPDVALHTGDLVEHGASIAEWEIFFEIERDLMAHVPLFPALGNHEGNDPLYLELFHLPGNERWYSFDYGNARFICLQVDGIAAFGAGSEQYAWLEETLASHGQTWLFVIFHVPPYTSSREGMESNVRRTLTPLFEQYGVDLVFNGHKHNYERNEVNGVTYVVTGGGGAPLYRMVEQEPTQAAFALEYHFVLLAVDDDQLKARAISSQGELLDSFERRAAFP